MEKQPNINLERRNILKTAGLVAAAATITTTPTAMAASNNHEHHHHGPSSKEQDVLHATAHCLIMGKICLQHCIDLYKMGDSAMADCMDTVTDMLATCEAMNTLAATNSALAKDMAKVCMKACEACEKECKKHADKHEACKNCAESCVECIKACKALAA